MNPSKEECEKTLADFSQPTVIAISVFAAGYLSSQEAIDYVANSPNIKGVAVGVSKEKHSCETFRLFKDLKTKIEGEDGEKYKGNNRSMCQKC